MNNYTLNVTVKGVLVLNVKANSLSEAKEKALTLAEQENLGDLNFPDYTFSENALIDCIPEFSQKEDTEIDY